MRAHDPDLQRRSTFLLTVPPASAREDVRRSTPPSPAPAEPFEEGLGGLEPALASGVVFMGATWVLQGGITQEGVSAIKVFFLMLP